MISVRMQTHALGIKRARVLKLLINNFQRTRLTRREEKEEKRAKGKLAWEREPFRLSLSPIPSPLFLAIRSVRSKSDCSKKSQFVPHIKSQVKCSKCVNAVIWVQSSDRNIDESIFRTIYIIVRAWVRVMISLLTFSLKVLRSRSAGLLAWF